MSGATIEYYQVLSRGSPTMGNYRLLWCTIPLWILSNAMNHYDEILVLLMWISFTEMRLGQLWEFCFMRKDFIPMEIIIVTVGGPSGQTTILNTFMLKSSILIVKLLRVPGKSIRWEQEEGFWGCLFSPDEGIGTILDNDRAVLV